MGNVLRRHADDAYDFCDDAVHVVNIDRDSPEFGHVVPLDLGEKLNQYIRAAFLSELAASKFETLDALNEAFIAWADEQYNRKIHSETGQAPLERWRQDAEKVRYADEEELRLAFLWRERRTPDKTAVFSLFGRRYQVGAALARRQVEIRYDHESLDEVEVWRQGRFVERGRPFQVRDHRRPRDPELRPQEPNKESQAPACPSPRT